jgi:hypothetical protein
LILSGQKPVKSWNKYAILFWSWCVGRLQVFHTTPNLEGQGSPLSGTYSLTSPAQNALPVATLLLT